MTLDEFNSLPASQSNAALLDCCGCARWASEMCERRPFSSVNAVLDAADANCKSMKREDWLEAFSHHPQIGEKAASGSESHRRWAAGEQSGARDANEDVKTRIARGNGEYHDKFGYIYIVCASGKSAEEMLALLKRRLENDPMSELPIAAEQQRQITQLRLKKLLSNEPS